MTRTNKNRTRQLRRMWRSEMPTDEIAAQLGVTKNSLYTIAHRAKLGRRGPEITPQEPVRVRAPTMEELNEWMRQGGRAW